MKPKDFNIICKKCDGSDVEVFSGTVSYEINSYEIITKIRCKNERCKHVEQI